MSNRFFMKAGRALALTLTLALAPATQAAAATKATAPADKAHIVKGFRSALFGQTVDQVTASIAKDFGKPPVQRVADTVNGTTAIAITLPALPPGPGAATVTYIFGKNGALIHVNVVWLLTGNVPAIQRTQLTDAGLKLSDYMSSFSWPAKQAARNLPTGPNEVTMFIGKDASGNAVEVSANGVSFQRNINGRAVPSPPPTGPARLRVAYGSAAETKAVTQIMPGQF